MINYDTALLPSADTGLSNNRTCDTRSKMGALISCLHRVFMRRCAFSCVFVRLLYNQSKTRWNAYLFTHKTNAYWAKNKRIRANTRKVARIRMKSQGKRAFMSFYLEDVSQQYDHQSRGDSWPVQTGAWRTREVRLLGWWRNPLNQTMSVEVVVLNAYTGTRAPVRDGSVALNISAPFVTRTVSGFRLSQCA